MISLQKDVLFDAKRIVGNNTSKWRNEHIQLNWPIDHNIELILVYLSINVRAE